MLVMFENFLNKRKRKANNFSKSFLVLFLPELFVQAIDLEIKRNKGIEKPNSNNNKEQIAQFANNFL
jgi:hypothetical protein